MEPLVQEEPGGHGVHSLADSRPVALEYEPGGHGSDAADPNSA